MLGEGTVGAERRLAAALRLLALETEPIGQGGSGGGAILARTIEIVFVQAVRAMIERRVRLGDDAPGAGRGNPERLEPAASGTGFLAALGDRHLARALTVVHGAPERPWTLTALAREAGRPGQGADDRGGPALGARTAAFLA